MLMRTENFYAIDQCQISQKPQNWQVPLNSKL
jgi:hypothetical protein